MVGPNWPNQGEIVRTPFPSLPPNPKPQQQFPTIPQPTSPYLNLLNHPLTQAQDIIEGVNQNTYNHITLHTSSNCIPSTTSPQTGHRVGNTDCGASGGYVGCGVESTSPTSYGTAFNANGGGTYAMLWTSSGIRVWYFAARDVPGDIKGGNPDPGRWGTPQASFEGGGCDWGRVFGGMRLVSCGYFFLMCAVLGV